MDLAPACRLAPVGVLIGLGYICHAKLSVPYTLVLRFLLHLIHLYIQRTFRVQLLCVWFWVTMVTGQKVEPSLALQLLNSEFCGLKLLQSRWGWGVNHILLPKGLPIFLQGSPPTY